MDNLVVAAKANHEIWYAGQKPKLSHPDQYAFRGDIPTGKTLELVALQGVGYDSLEAESRPFARTTSRQVEAGQFDYTFSGNESHVMVSDLSLRRQLGIPTTARPEEKVFNCNFREYSGLSQMTKFSNELAALSVPKSISSYFGGIHGKINYSERDVLNLLTVSFENLNSPEMMHILHGNHLAWAALSYIRENGNVEGDILAEFHGQNPSDFYTKDLGTILPAMFFALASLGKNPITFYKKLDVEIYGAKDSAEYMTKYMLV